MRYGFGPLLDLDSVHCRIGSGDSQGTGRLQYRRGPRRDGIIAEEPRGAGLRPPAWCCSTPCGPSGTRPPRRRGDRRRGARSRGPYVGHICLHVIVLHVVCTTLGALTTARLVRRSEPVGSPAGFEGRVGDNHHHVLCRSCGVVADVDRAAGAARG
ncbi:transcriptional repressor [Wenjunlia tyrosinilytica]|uniref:transcriptional repressor n=1 Tax=Wenjunlia tyrosinilytica TaxID=1544741 RepID=UPI001663F9FF